MVDLTEEEHAAITATMRRMGALMGEIGWRGSGGDVEHLTEQRPGEDSTHRRG